MAFTFFFSYARDDRANSSWLHKFYKDLTAEVKKRDPSSRGFFDTADIQTGQSWSEELEDALKTAKVFVCLASPTYITRPICGKEFQVFRERRHSHQNDLPHSIILPVIWIPITGALPETLSECQLHDDSLPEEYKQNGLEYLMKLQKKRDQYQEFLMEFSKKVVEGGQQSGLTELLDLRPFDQIPSAFRQPGQGDTQLQEQPESTGPNTATFIFVAARKNEMHGYKPSLDCYDAEGGWFWRPFLPLHGDRIGDFAQEVVVQDKFRYNEIPLGPDLRERLSHAHRNNTIAILLLDPWTMKVEQYRTWLRHYDTLSFLNCTLLIPWNEGDPDTSSSRGSLENLLKAELPTKYFSKPSLFFRDNIQSPEDLRQSLRETLAQLKMKILEAGEAKKRINATAVRKPTLQGPGQEL